MFAVSKTGMPHLSMSLIFIGVQTAINLVIVRLIQLSVQQQLIYSALLLFGLSVIYSVIKKYMMKEAS